jgi:hypothetical protein
MKITEKQLQVMLRVLQGSLQYNDTDSIDAFGYNYIERKNVFNGITNQQSDKLIDIRDEREMTDQDKEDFEFFKQSRIIVEDYLSDDNYDIRQALIEFKDSVPVRYVRKWLSHINSLFLNVMLNRLHEVGEEGYNKAIKARTIIVELLRNE